MVTTKQIHANRLNAQKSTGPKTPEGLQRSSANSLKYGLTASTFVLRLEETHDYKTWRRAYIKEWQPEGATEQQLVIQLAQTGWQIQRAQRAITELLNAEISSAMVDLTPPRIKAAENEIESLTGKAEARNQSADRLDELKHHLNNLTTMERTSRAHLNLSSISVGAALARLGPRQQKLDTVLRYWAHLDRTAERVVRQLMFLRETRSLRKQPAAQNDNHVSRPKLGSGKKGRQRD